LNKDRKKVLKTSLPQIIKADDVSENKQEVNQIAEMN
jgi:hypothetical protein